EAVPTPRLTLAQQAAATAHLFVCSVCHVPKPKADLAPLVESTCMSCVERPREARIGDLNFKPRDTAEARQHRRIRMERMGLRFMLKSATHAATHLLLECRACRAQRTPRSATDELRESPRVHLPVKPGDRPGRP